MSPSVLAQKALNKAKFDKSSPTARGLPEDRGMEVAFAGRSNSGKSTTLNALCGRRSLARTSRTPGRTQHLVVFKIDESRRLVDLPGFGYAKVSQRLQTTWKKEVNRYLNFRKSLVGLILIMDVRHVLQPIELDLLNWCSEADLSTHVLLNKSDKLGRSAAQSALTKVKRCTNNISRNGGTSVDLFSAKNRLGCDGAWNKVAEWFCFDSAI